MSHLKTNSKNGSKRSSINSDVTKRKRQSYGNLDALVLFSSVQMCAEQEKIDLPDVSTLKKLHLSLIHWHTMMMSNTPYKMLLLKIILPIMQRWAHCSHCWAAMLRSMYLIYAVKVREKTVMATLRWHWGVFEKDGTEWVVHLEPLGKRLVREQSLIRIGRKKGRWGRWIWGKVWCNN